MRRAHWRPVVVGVVLTVTGVVSTPATPMSSQSSVQTATAAQQRAIVEGYAAVLSEARLTGGLDERPVKRIRFDDILVDTRRASLPTQELIRDISCASSLVVTGTAAKVAVFVDADRHALFTEYAIAVGDVLRGAIDASPIRYIRPGGESDLAGGRTAMQHDRFPALNPDATYVFLLQQLSGGFWGAAAEADVFVVERGAGRVLPSSRGNRDMADGIAIADLTRWIRPCAPTPLGGISDGRSGLPRPPGDKAQLAGDVHDAVDGRPLRDALVVMAHPDGSFTAPAGGRARGRSGTRGDSAARVTGCPSSCGGRALRTPRRASAGAWRSARPSARRRSLSRRSQRL